jgi:hypothetical protein
MVWYEEKNFSVHRRDEVSVQWNSLFLCADSAV